MTRVVVQRGGLSNQTQCRPPSGPPSSAPLPPSASASSITPPLNTQSSFVSILSPFAVLSSSSISSVSREEFPAIEAQILEREPHSSTVAGASVKSAPETKATSEVEPVVGRGQCFGNLEISTGEAPDMKEDLVRQVTHDLVVEETSNTAAIHETGSSRGMNIVSFDEEGQIESCDTARIERSSLEASCRKQSGRISSAQSNPSAGQNAPSTPYLSNSSMPFFVSISYSPSDLQPVSCAPQLPPPSIRPLPVASSDTLPRIHEENVPARLTSIPMSSDPVGSSYSPLLAPSTPLTPVSLRRCGWVGSSASNANRGSTSRRIPRALKGIRSPPNSSRPTSPRSYGEGDGYNSADELSPWTPGPSGYEDSVERERQFEMELLHVKGLEVRHMTEDGNCLFRAVADRVYGDADMYDETRQMCIDYMEKERDHFSQFLTESFTAYCKRKRRDKVYGNNLEIQAMAEIYYRPVLIYSYSTEPINIFHGNYETDLPPIRLSYHHGNHYNSIVDPCNPAVGAGLGFGSLRGRNVDTEQVKAALNAQQEQQIEKALLAEGRYYSDLQLTEQEIECMVLEASRAEYLAEENRQIHISWHEETSTSAGSEPSSSRTIGSPRNTNNVIDSLQASIRHAARSWGLPVTSSPSEGGVLSRFFQSG